MTRLLLLGAVLLGGCAFSIGLGTKTDYSKDNGIVIQDGKRWVCVVLKESYVAEPDPWREIRKGACFEVKP